MASPIKIEHTSYNIPLKHARRTFAQYDESAKQQQKEFNRLQIWIPVLGVIATALALSQTQFRNFFEDENLENPDDTLQNRTISLAI